jgi:hypothetical protein
MVDAVVALVLYLLARGGAAMGAEALLSCFWRRVVSHGVDCVLTVVEGAEEKDVPDQGGLACEMLRFDSSGSVSCVASGKLLLAMGWLGIW